MSKSKEVVVKLYHITTITLMTDRRIRNTVFDKTIIKLALFVVTTLHNICNDVATVVSENAKLLKLSTVFKYIVMDLRYHLLIYTFPYSVHK